MHPSLLCYVVTRFSCLVLVDPVLFRFFLSGRWFLSDAHFSDNKFLSVQESNAQFGHGRTVVPLVYLVCIVSGEGRFALTLSLAGLAILHSLVCCRRVESTRSYLSCVGIVTHS